MLRLTPKSEPNTDRSSTMLRLFTRVSLALALLLVLAACGDAAAPDAGGDASTGTDPTAAEGVTVTVHRTAACECCGVYEDYLESAGFTVETVVHDDMATVKADFGVPDDQRSCHTNEVGGYAAEGHVPAAALLQLLDESPAISGISLAGMPTGSPGMPGEQTEPFEVRTFIDGEVVGDLGSF